MSTVTPPRVGIPLGVIVIDGKTYEMQAHPEWVRYLDGLFKRVGGATGLGTMDVDAGYFAAMQPISTASQEVPELWQPCAMPESFSDVTQTGGDCCLPEMIFQG